MHCSCFPIRCFVCTVYLQCTHVTPKPAGCMYMNVVHIEQLLYCPRCLFYGLELHTRYDWWVMAQNVHHSLFPIRHLYIVIHILENYRLFMDVLHTKRLLRCQKHSWCCLELNERFYWRTRVSRHTTLCAYTASPYKHHYLVCNYAR